MFYYNFLSLCNNAGKSPSAAAEEMGFQRSVVTRWSKGTAPRQATLQKIADYFGVPVSSLASDEPKEKPDTNNGAELKDATRQIMDIISDFSPEELALVISRIQKIKDSR